MRIKGRRGGPERAQMVVGSRCLEALSPPSPKAHVLTQRLRATYSLPVPSLVRRGPERRDTGNENAPDPPPTSDLRPARPGKVHA